MTVRTVAEMLTTRGEVWLAADHPLRMTVLDRDGQELCEDACGSPAHVEPRDRLPHGLWLKGQFDTAVSAVNFTGLPAGEVEFHLTCLREVLRHDPRVPAVQFRSQESVDDLMLGK